MNKKKVGVFIIILICTFLCGMIFNSKMKFLTEKETKNIKIIEKVDDELSESSIRNSGF